MTLPSQRHIPKMARCSSGTFWSGVGHQVGRCDGTGAHTKFSPESVPCSLKAGEGPAHFALASQEPTAIPGKTTKGTQGRNVHPQRKGGVVTDSCQQTPAGSGMGQPKSRNGNQAKLRLGIGTGLGWEEVLVAVRDPMEKTDGLSTSRWMRGTDCRSGSEAPAKHSLLAQYRDSLTVPHGQQDAPMPSQPLAL